LLQIQLRFFFIFDVSSGRVQARDCWRRIITDYSNALQQTDYK